MTRIKADRTICQKARLIGTSIAVLSFYGMSLGCSKEPAAAAEPPKAHAQQELTSAASKGGRADSAGERQEARENARSDANTADNRVERAPAGARNELAVSDIQEQNFSLKIKPGGVLKANAPGTVMIELNAKGPFKVNQEYPYKFKVTEAKGLKVEATITKDQVVLEKKRAVMTVPLTPESAGEKRLSGKFLFSVCTDEKCLIEKRDLGVTLNVN